MLRYFRDIPLEMNRPGTNLYTNQQYVTVKLSIADFLLELLLLLLRSSNSSSTDMRPLLTLFLCCLSGVDDVEDESRSKRLAGKGASLSSLFDFGGTSRSIRRC